MNKALLPYGVSTLDPAIEIPDTSIVKDKIKRNVETKITARFDELQREAQVVMDIFNINKSVLESEFSFEPKQNKIYHLYEREDGSTFLSLIEPERWEGQFFHLSAVRLTSEGLWEDHAMV